MTFRIVTAAAVLVATISVVCQAAPTEDQLQRIEALVLEEEYVQALKAVDGLLVLNPDDPQLLSYQKDLRSLVQPDDDSPASAARPSRESDTAPGATTLTQRDRVTLATLQSIGKEMAQAAQGGEKAVVESTATEYLEQSVELLRRQPGLAGVWAGRALAAIAIDHIEAGWEAGRELQRLDAESDTAMAAMVELRRKEWLGELTAVAGSHVAPLLDEAAALAEEAGRSSFVDSTVLDVRRLQAKCGLTEQALSWGKRSDDDEIRSVIVDYLTSIGEMSQAEELIAAIRSPHDRAIALIHLARAYAERSDESRYKTLLKSAGQAAASISESADRDQVYYRLSELTAGLGDVEAAALHTSRIRGRSYFRNHSRKEIAIALVRRGDLEGGLARVDNIEPELGRVWVLTAIAALKRVPGGKATRDKCLDEALRIARTDPSVRSKVWHLTHIALVYSTLSKNAESERLFVEAKRMALSADRSGLVGGSDRDGALSNVALNCVRTKRFDDAEMLIAEIGRRFEGRHMASSALAIAKAKEGRHREALAIARQVDNGFGYRAKAIAGVAEVEFDRIVSLHLGRHVSSVEKALSAGHRRVALDVLEDAEEIMSEPIDPLMVGSERRRHMNRLAVLAQTARGGETEPE